MDNSATQKDVTIPHILGLLKPRVISLVAFTGLAGMVTAPGFDAAHPFLLLMSLIFMTLGAGAAGALNMWYDRDIDTIMTRTRTRPIPAGWIAADDVLHFAILLSFTSVMMMALASNILAAGLLAFSILFYGVFYTMVLKRRTPQNIVIGGAAGAFPPMIGWAAVTGEITLFPILQFLIIFLWTPPHFWALSLLTREEYERAKIPMLPNVHGVKNTKLQILLYTIALVPVTLAPAYFGFTGWVYVFAAAVMNVGFIWAALKVYLKDKAKYPRLLFKYSILYLFILFLAMMYDATPGNPL